MITVHKHRLSLPVFLLFEHRACHLIRASDKLPDQAQADPAQIAAPIFMS